MMLQFIIKTISQAILSSLWLWYILITNSPCGLFSLPSPGALGLQVLSHDFVQKPLCYVTDRVAEGCMIPVNLPGSVTSAGGSSTDAEGSSPSAMEDLLQCAILCVQNGSCVGCSRSVSDSKQAHSQVYQHWPCYRVFPICQDENNEIEYLERTNACQNGGDWDQTVKRCSCADTVSYVGEFCQRSAESCAELEASGYSVGSLQTTFNISGYQGGISASCYLFGRWKDWAIVIFFRTSGSITTSFINRTWDEYREGFWESSSDNGWMGLSNMVKVLHHTRPTDVKLRVSIGDSRFKQTYHGFDLEEDEDYTLTYTSVSVIREYGTDVEPIPSPCFSELTNGSKFSTWDRDNDDDPVLNCAANAGGGWWYHWCNEDCNIFLPAYDTQNLEPESYTKIRIGGVNLRDWAGKIGNSRLFIYQPL
ncbi:angiopoietin-related protein 1-like [Plakobranchus ocellatus]|uniref:Angiopoietin-related protein 1-like n=1 Tax=Plakobranchus ocellatus TaxID=259542 RepID=A0AAV3YMX5_9GAST|nr:angiopoietin-related protein 1-like [Plakobranchus ocellatus]